MFNKKKIFAIVVANYNGASFLPVFLDSLVRQTDTSFKLFFVDNGSSDESISIVSHYSPAFDIQIISLTANEGFARANNVGIEAALDQSYEYIITLNNDIEMQQDCLKNCRIFIELHPECNFFQILMMNYYERDIIDAAGIFLDHRFNVTQIAYKKSLKSIKIDDLRINGVCAGAAIYSAKSLHNVKDKNGFFNQHFFAYYEDVDLDIRLLKLDYQPLLINDAIVYHVHSGTAINNSNFKTFYIARNNLLYRYVNHVYSNFGFVIFTFYFISKLSVMSLLKGRFGDLKPIFKGMRSFIDLDYDKLKDV